MHIEIVVYVFDEIFIDQQEFIRNSTKLIFYFSKCINDRDGIYNLNRLALGSSFAAFVAAVFFVDFFTEILSCSCVKNDLDDFKALFSSPVEFLP